MSFFSETLRALMSLHQPPLTGIDLAALSRISSSTISRVQNGQQVPSSEHVAGLCAVISQARARRVELLIAHLRDVVAAAALAGIDERHVTVRAASDFSSSSLLSADLQLLAEECAKHDDIRALVADLARMVIRHRAEVIDANMYAFPGGGALGGERAPAEAPEASTAAVALNVLKQQAARKDVPQADKASPPARK
jgi:transcriptional regulator with XRE-family HTH domain